METDREIRETIVMTCYSHYKDVLYVLTLLCNKITDKKKRDNLQRTTANVCLNFSTAA